MNQTNTIRSIFCSWIAALCCLSPSIGASSTTQNDAVIDAILHHLKNIQETDANQRRREQRPIVTVAFAQSLDARLAPFKDSSLKETAANYPISGPESLRLTHAIRSVHDGIMIGGKTLELDNPRLNNRLWHSDNPDRPQPIPVVLDTNLDHLNKLVGSLKAKNLIVCCSEQAADSLESLPEPLILCPCRCAPDGRIDLEHALCQLYQHHGIRTVMIEGGAQVISSVFAADLADALCITVAPKVLGQGISVAYGQQVLDTKDGMHVHLLETDLIFFRPILTVNRHC